MNAQAAADFSWRPVLSGADASDAQAIASRIVSRLIADVAVDANSGRWRLVNGLAGFALVLDYARRCGIRVPSGLTEDLIFRGMRASEDDWNPSLYFGVAGIAWAGDVSGAWTQLGDDFATRFDTELADLLHRPAAVGSHSLLSGLSGIGVYAVRRIPRSGPGNATAVVRRLEETAVEEGGGRSWLTSHSVSPGRGVSWFNFGMAQGFPSAISFLAHACREKVPGAESLLYESGRWLSRQQISDRPGRCFPLGIEGGEKISIDTRPGWCNGDLSTAIALLQAGVCLGEPSWVDTASHVARLAASLPADDLPECGLCHGAAGVGFMFAFLNYLTQTSALAEASQCWFRQVIGRANAAEPYDGFEYLLELPWDAPPSASPQWRSSGEFLRGAGGIALALLAASNSVPPTWGGALMMPPVAQ